MNLLWKVVLSKANRVIYLSFSDFPQVFSFTFNIDVDGQLAESESGQIRVSDLEIAGSVSSVIVECRLAIDICRLREVCLIITSIAVDIANERHVLSSGLQVPTNC